MTKWLKYRNRLILIGICTTLVFILIIYNGISDKNLITISGHLKSKPFILKYGGDVQKVVIDINLKEFNKKYRIKGICGVRSTRVDLLENLKEGDFVQLQIKQSGNFFSFDDKIYSLKDQTQEYLIYSKYLECNSKKILLLFLFCLSIIGFTLISILKEERISR